jgi:hypothetical protein
LDFLEVSLGACAFEQREISLTAFDGFTSSQDVVMIGVGDSVRFVAHGICQGAGLHISFGTSRARGRASAPAVVRLSSASEIAQVAGEPMATVWAVGLAPGSSAVSAVVDDVSASMGLVVAARGHR